MPLSDGLKMTLLVNGVHQITESEVSLEIDGKNQPIETLEGFAGKTQGAGVVTVTGTGYIPVSGPEFDYFTEVFNGGYHTLQVPLGPKSYIGNGYFDNCKIMGSVGKATEISFTWLGEFAKPK
jgi:hypothetical protein